MQRIKQFFSKGIKSENCLLERFLQQILSRKNWRTDIFKIQPQVYNNEQSTMYISNTKYRLAELKYQHLPFIAKFFARGFVLQNKVWSTIKFQIEQVEQFMYNKHKELLEWQQQQRDNGVIGKDTFLNFIYLDQKDNIVGAVTHCELSQYLSKKSKVVLEKWKILEQYGLQLEKSINPRDVQPGRCVYGMFIGVSKQVFGLGVTMLMFFDAFHYMNTQGLRIFYGRASNIRTIAYAANYGQVTAKFRIKEAKNQELYITMTKFYMDPQIFIKDAIKYFCRKSNL